MQPGENFISLMISLEGLNLYPYLDSVGIPTIGIGSTHYEDGTGVTMRDVKITYERAVHMLNIEVEQDINVINTVIKSTINQNQFDALIACCYNIGKQGFKQSTIVKRVNHDPNDPTIKDAFLMWVYGHDVHTGKLVKLKGLINRRNKEYTLYSTPWQS